MRHRTRANNYGYRKTASYESKNFFRRQNKSKRFSVEQYATTGFSVKDAVTDER